MAENQVRNGVLPQSVIRKAIMLTRRKFILKIFECVLFCAIAMMGLEREARARSIFLSVPSGSGEGACVSGNGANCVLLIHSNTTDGSTTFVDSSQGGSDHTADITAVGNVHHETDQQKFGTSSIETDAGPVGYLSIADSADWDFGTGDFSIEFWFRFKASVQNKGLVGKYAGEANTWGLTYSTNLLYWYYGNGVSWSKAWTPVADTWYHICIARASATLRWFIDGTQIGTSETDNTNYDTATALVVGSYDPALSALVQGYFDEIAIFKGSANGRTANFTPPTGPYCD